MTTLGWDCIVIPGARKGTASATFTGDSGRPMRWCGQSEGLVTKAAAGGAAGTICCKNSLQWIMHSIIFKVNMSMASIILIFFLSAKHTPFNIQFLTDHIEMQNEALVDNNATPKTGSGFQLAFFMRASDC